MEFCFNPSLWYICRMCKEGFSDTDKLKEHKLENHLGDCLKVKWIVFEEKFVGTEWNPSNQHQSHVPSKSKTKNQRSKRHSSKLFGEAKQKFQNPYVALTRLSPQKLNSALRMKRADTEPSIPSTSRKRRAVQSTTVKTIAFVDESHGSKTSEPNSINPNSKVDDTLANVVQNTTVIPIEKIENSDISDTKKVPIESQNITFMDGNTRLILDDGTVISIATCSAEIGTVSLETSQSASEVNSHANTTNEAKHEESLSLSSKVEFKIKDDFQSHTYASLKSEPDSRFIQKQEPDSFNVATNNVPSPEINPESDSDSDSQVKSEPDSEAEPETESATDPEPEPETESATDPELEQDPEPEPKSVSLKSRKNRGLVLAKSGSASHLTVKDKNLDLQLHLSLSQWVSEEREKYPSNIILLEPDPTTISEDFPPISLGNTITCKWCQTSFCTEVDVRTHVHKCFLLNKRRHRFCLLCNKSFARTTNLKIHEETIHSETPRPPLTNVDKPYKCTHCPAVFKRTPDLNRHLVIHGKETPFKCPTCGRFCHSLDTLRDHERSHSNDRSFKCTVDLCIMAFKTKQSLLVHKRLKHGEELGLKPFPCPMPECNRVFGLRAHLKVHLKDPRYHRKPEDESSEIPKPFQCTICGAAFLLKYYLTGHMKSHSDARPWPCPHAGCKAAFKRNQELQRHLIVHGKPTPYMCSYCSKSCQSAECLADHERIHTGDKPYNCSFEQCGASFASKNSLWSHKRSVHGEVLGLKQFPCSAENCGKVFGTYCHLNRHIKVCHTGERPFKCTFEDSCDQTFKCKNSLVEHVRVAHTGDTPFQCEKCGKAFSRRKGFIDHLKIHDGSFTAKCHFCPRKFVGTWALKQHLKQHEEGIAFPCQFCGLECTTKAYLKKHEKSHLDEGPEIQILEVIEDGDDDGNRGDEEQEENNGEDGSFIPEIELVAINEEDIIFMGSIE